MGKPVLTVGIPWYREQDWAGIKRVMRDSDILPGRYGDWLEAAEKLEIDIQNRGDIVKRAYIDPAEFRGWCALRCLAVDAAARDKFASAFNSKKSEFPKLKRSDRIGLAALATGIVAAAGANWLFGGAHWVVLLVIGLVVMTIANVVWLACAALIGAADRER